MFPEDKFDIIDQFILDVLHGCDEGIMNKLMDNLAGGCFTIANNVLAGIVSHKIISLSKWVPSEFNRKGRILKHLSLFKAAEFRLILLYTGYLIFED